jgi:hypothetical protein
MPSDTCSLEFFRPKDADEVAEGVEMVDFPEDDNEGDEGEEEEKMEPDNITLLNPGEEEEGMEGMQVEGEETDQLQIDEGKMSASLSRVFPRGAQIFPERFLCHTHKY